MRQVRPTIAWLVAWCACLGCARAAAPNPGADAARAQTAPADAALDFLDTPPDSALAPETAATDLFDGGTALADAATAEAAGDDAVVSDLTDVTAAVDATALCPLAAPPDAVAADLGTPPGAPCSAIEGPPWWPAGAEPPPTLPVKLGHHVPGAGWQAYESGGWAPLQQGGQGGGLFHLAVAPKVLLQGTSLPVTDLAVQVLVLQGCALVASADKAKFAFVQATDPEDWYVPDPSKALVAVFVQPGEQSKHNACAGWLHVIARARILPGGVWGQSQVMLRAYNDTAAPSGPKP